VLAGTVPRSMATLFQMMTLDSWMSGITRPIGDVYTFAFFFFFVFVAFASLGAYAAGRCGPIQCPQLAPTSCPP
jgi:choline-glycine betaine transporter